MSLPKNKIDSFNKDLAFILAQLAYHISPKIIKYIAERNKVECQFFKDIFGDKIDFENYLFDGSDCVFPGVRRWDPKRGKKRKYNIDYEAIIDDNGFPRYIWCYLFTGKGASGPNWKNFSEFELAHIFAHKGAEIIGEKNYFRVFDEKKSPFAQFTSATNVVLLPKGTVRPTDNSTIVKSIFYKRHIDLYGEDTLNGRSGFKDELIPDWYSELKWNDTLAPDDWKENIDTLLNYRNKRIVEILENAGFVPAGTVCPNKCIKRMIGSRQTNGQKDSTKYLLNGQIYGKSSLVKAVVKAYIKKYPNSTWKKLQEAFPQNLQGGIGVVDIFENVKTKFAHQKKNKRHFLNTEDINKLNDGEKIVVCMEWGISNINKFITRAKEIGFNIEEDGKRR